MREAVKLSGRLTVRLFGPDGKLKLEIQFPNVITTVGKQELAARMAAASVSAEYMPYIGIGDDGSEAFASDTDLGNQLFRKLGSASSSGAVYTNSVTFAAGEGTGTIREWGLFDASSGGNMGARTSNFSPFTKGAGDTMQAIWEITVA